MGANQAGSCEVPTRLMNIVNDKRKKEEVKSVCWGLVGCNPLSFRLRLGD